MWRRGGIVFSGVTVCPAPGRWSACVFFGNVDCMTSGHSSVGVRRARLSSLCQKARLACPLVGSTGAFSTILQSSLYIQTGPLDPTSHSAFRTLDGMPVVAAGLHTCAYEQTDLVRAHSLYLYPPILYCCIAG